MEDTGAGGRACIKCEVVKGKDSFSKRQWAAKAHSRKCLACVADATLGTEAVENSAETSKAEEMCCGAIMRIHSLSGVNSMLNGKHGELMEYRQDRRRWVVKICHSGKVINVIASDHLIFVRRPYRYNINTGKSCEKEVAS